MINTERIEMYPAFLIQKAIENGVTEFTPRFIAFQDKHTDKLIELMKIQNIRLYGEEESIKCSWRNI